MSATQAAPSGIVDLPEEILVNVVAALTGAARGNAGDVCRLMLVRTKQAQRSRVSARAM